jgi:hypothetical protein
VSAAVEIKAANGGRFKFKGMIDLASVSKQALRDNNAGNGQRALKMVNVLSVLGRRVSIFHEGHGLDFPRLTRPTARS